MSKFSRNLPHVHCQKCRFSVQNRAFAAAGVGVNLGNCFPRAIQDPVQAMNAASELIVRPAAHPTVTESTNARTGRFVVRAVMGTARL